MEVHNPILSKEFLRSLFWVQNKWHQHGIFIHTLRVVYHTLKAKEYKMITAAFLHDIGKPSTAFVKDEEDVKYGEYSFTDHEERSYQVIKNCSFISDYTKKLVRYHYLIRDIKKSKTRDPKRYELKSEIWDSLDDTMKNDLYTFLSFDDAGKGTKRR